MPKIPRSFTVSAKAFSFYLLCDGATNEDIFVIFTGKSLKNSKLLIFFRKKNFFQLCGKLLSAFESCLTSKPLPPRTFPASSVTAFPGDCSFLPLEYNSALTFFDYRVLGPYS